MSQLTDSLLAVPISVVYYLMIEKLSNIMFINLPHVERHNNRFILVFTIGLLTMAISNKLVDAINKDVSSSFVKYGLIAGGLALSTSITISYWYEMNDQMKLSVFFIIFIGLLYISNIIKKHLEKSNEEDELDDINDLIE